VGCELTEESIVFETLNSVLKEFLKQIRELSKCQSVAIRLYKDGDFPYYQHLGFTDFFIRKANSLNARDSEGNLILDADGAPIVGCVCGHVLKNRVNSQHVNFTEDGGFWTCSTTRFLESLTESERNEISGKRNTCHDHGYESVALIPIRANGATIGFIQINDPREDMFTREKVKKYQSLADYLGIRIPNIFKFHANAAHPFSPVSEL
jgi:hypothetical protein